MTPDWINGTFEALGGLFIFNHCRVLYKDKAVRGVSLLSTAFFMAWGIWNLYYYPFLDQWVSMFGGIVISTAQLTWIIMMVYYMRKNHVQHSSIQ